MLINEFGPVVVGVDGSAASLSAVDLAAEEALGRVAPLVVVHACGAWDAGKELLAVAAARARAEHPGLSVTTELVWGNPSAVLAARSKDASLLVIGHDLRCPGWGVGGWAPGSVAAEMLHRAGSAVLIHRPLDSSGSVPVPRPVLLGVPGGGVDVEAAVEFAFAEADMRGAPLTGMHVWSWPDDGDPARGCGQRGFAQARDEADGMLVAALERWADKYPGVRVHRTVRHSPDVPAALLAAARSAQLIVVGAVHRSAGARGRRLVTDALMHRAGCPVAVVPLQSVR